MRNLVIVSLAVLSSSLAPKALADPRTKAPWRLDDMVRIDVCFDKLDRTAPETLKAEEITDVSVGGERAELTAFTLSDRPNYVIGASHPVEFRTVLLQLPGSDVRVRIDAPPLEFLKSAINAGRYGPAPTVCTTDERASMLLVHGRKLASTVQCPDLGMIVGFRVVSQQAFSASRALARQRGVSVMNGLKGCKEFLY